MAPPRLTREQAEVLVEQHGGQHAAARAYGVAYSTLRYWLNPKLHNERGRRYYRENSERVRRRQREYWRNLSGSDYNRRLLQMRRILGLRRMAERNRRSAEEAS